MKRILGILLILLFCQTGSLWAEKLAQVGHFDLSTIVSKFYKDSKDIRQLRYLNEEYSRIQSEYDEKSEELGREKEEALEDDDSDAIVEITEEMNNLITLTRQRLTVKRLEIERLKEALIENEGFSSQLIKAIRSVAMNHGYSHIIEVSAPYLYYANEDFNVTELILEELVQQNAE